MRNDPRWMVARYAGVDRNGTAYRKGDRVFYYPLTKAVLAGAHAEQAALDFEAECFDERMLGG